VAISVRILGADWIIVELLPMEPMVAAVVDADGRAKARAVVTAAAAAGGDIFVCIVTRLVT